MFAAVTPAGTKWRLDGAAADAGVGSFGPGGGVWLLGDRQESVVGTTQASGGGGVSWAAYAAFGGGPSPSSAPAGWTGRPTDAATGLQYNRSRWYDPATGRWVSLDSMGFAAGDGNLYRYVGNAPTNATDPSGTQERGNGMGGPPTAGRPPGGGGGGAYGGMAATQGLPKAPSSPQQLEGLWARGPFGLPLTPYPVSPADVPGDDKKLAAEAAKQKAKELAIAANKSAALTLNAILQGDTAAGTILHRGDLSGGRSISILERPGAGGTKERLRVVADVVPNPAYERFVKRAERAADDALPRPSGDLFDPAIVQKTAEYGRERKNLLSSLHEFAPSKTLDRPIQTTVLGAGTPVEGALKAYAIAEDTADIEWWDEFRDSIPVWGTSAKLDKAIYYWDKDAEKANENMFGAALGFADAVSLATGVYGLHKAALGRGAATALAAETTRP